jgi:RimJ/RimL family protein N-acetyltransferase
VSGIPVLETERLVLREHRREDFEALYALWTHPEVARFISPTEDRAAGWRKFLMKPGMWAIMGFGYWVVEEKASGRLIGEVGVHDMQRGLQPSLDGTMEAGWTFLPEAQGKGYAREAMSAVIEWCGTAHPDLPITCIIDEENARSMKLAGALGFHETARTVYKDRACLVFCRS